MQRDRHVVDIIRCTDAMQCLSFVRFRRPNICAISICKQDADGEGRLRPPMPPPGELGEKYASSMILPICSIMWKYDVIQKTGST